jgi:hypothetical protein
LFKSIKELLNGKFLLELLFVLGDDFLLAFGLQVQFFDTVDEFFVEQLKLEFRNAFGIEVLTVW